MEPVPERSPASSLTPKRGSLEAVGCFSPIVLAAIGLWLGWWVGGAWAGLGGWIAGGVLGLLLFARVSRQGSTFCSLVIVIVVFLLLVAFLIPAADKIRKAAERMRTEHERKQQESPAPPVGKEK